MSLSTLTILTLLVSTTYGAYQLVDNYTPNNFASKFDFFTRDDYTHGYVNYVDQNTAQNLGLFKQQNGKLYMGADHTNVASGRGRNSVRITSKNRYTHGLFILDMDHMPGGQCGSWPAFWTVGPSWPGDGEIDIIEGVNSQAGNIMAVHTNAGCSIRNTQDFMARITTYNCHVNAPGQSANAGCAFKSDNAQTYGTSFNAGGGGVYAMEWTGEFIRIWFFSRSNIPSDIINGHPNPHGWGTPLSKFSGCNFNNYLRNHAIIFNITFCGDWAKNVWSMDGVCSRKARTCNEFVRNNPSAFKDTYWLINSLKVYKNQ